MSERDTASGTEQPEQARSSRGYVSRLRDLVYHKVVEPLVLSRNPPWFDARGVAAGLLVGFGIPMGGHTAMLLFLRLLVRFNFVVSIGVSCVINPLTIVPLYYGYYCLGSFLLGKPAELNRELFEAALDPIVSQGHSLAALRAFADLSGDIITRWITAAALVALVMGIAGYVITEKIQQKRCRKAAEKMGMSYRAYLAQLERRSAEDPARSGPDTESFK